MAIPRWIIQYFPIIFILGMTAVRLMMKYFQSDTLEGSYFSLKGEPPFQVQMSFELKGKAVSYYLNPRYRGAGRDLTLTDLEQDHVIPAYHEALIRACRAEQRNQNEEGEGTSPHSSPPSKPSGQDPCTKLSTMFPSENGARS